jgi:hypothetical protein
MIINNFFQIKKFLPLNIKDKLLEDINFEIKNNFHPTSPEFQTYSNLFKKYKHKDNWTFYFNKLNNQIKTICLENNKKFKLDLCWANIVKSKSTYSTHTHGKNILTTVYFVKNTYKEFGTFFNYKNHEFIVPGYENSLIIFEGDIPHSTTMPPEVLCKDDHRVTLTTDYLFF